MQGRKHQKSRIQESMCLPMVLKWKGGQKRSGEVKGMTLQKSRIHESMRFPMVLKWKGGQKTKWRGENEGNMRNQEFRRACVFLWF